MADEGDMGVKNAVEPTWYVVWFFYCSGVAMGNFQSKGLVKGLIISAAAMTILFIVTWIFRRRKAIDES